MHSLHPVTGSYWISSAFYCENPEAGQAYVAAAAAAAVVVVAAADTDLMTMMMMMCMW